MSHEIHTFPTSQGCWRWRNVGVDVVGPVGGLVWRNTGGLVGATVVLALASGYRVSLRAYLQRTVVLVSLTLSHQAFYQVRTYRCAQADLVMFDAVNGKGSKVSGALSSGWISVVDRPTRTNLRKVLPPAHGAFTTGYLSNLGCSIEIPLQPVLVAGLTVGHIPLCLCSRSRYTCSYISDRPWHQDRLMESFRVDVGNLMS
jgi:hypothetical protein